MKCTGSVVLKSVRGYKHFQILGLCYDPSNTGDGRSSNVSLTFIWDVFTPHKFLSRLSSVSSVCVPLCSLKVLPPYVSLFRRTSYVYPKTSTLFVPENGFECVL